MLLDLFAALLPAPERDAFVRRGADPARWSFVLGLLGLFLGVKLLLASALAFDQAQSSAIATHLLEKVDPRALNSFEAKLAVTESGALIWLAWAVRPTTWLLASLPAVGIARLVAFAATGDAFGEPFVWLALRARQLLAIPLRSLRRRFRFGPERPDRVQHEPGCDLVVLSGRPKPEWNELVSLEIGGRFYRLLRTEERQDRGWTAHAYLLKEAEPNEVLRGLLRYDPPGPVAKAGPGGVK
ncbi:MAG TPA: hypothetical protein VLX28_17460 [Thermoanaerobaculia bacterium]|nr:hypothetical protein [Thermoanaerobaculia bacterium]